MLGFGIKPSITQPLKDVTMLLPTYVLCTHMYKQIQM